MSERIAAVRYIGAPNVLRLGDRLVKPGETISGDGAYLSQLALRADFEIIAANVGLPIMPPTVLKKRK